MTRLDVGASAVPPEAGAAAACRPLRRDAELNRLKILRAAAQVFAERGVTVTLDDVAERAGVGVGTVYRRFPTKDALIEALFEVKIEKMVHYAQHAAAQPDAWNALVQFLRAAVMSQAQDRGLRQVLHSSGYGDQRVAHARSGLTQPLQQMIRAAKSQGALRADFELTDVPILMVMISSAAQYTSCADPKMWSRYLEMFIDGMRARPDLAPAVRPALTDEQLLSVMKQQES